MTRNRRRQRARRRRSFARRLLDLALAAAILGALALVVAHDRFGTVERPAGVPRVVDGDSLTIGALRIRLEGIDAPELGQTCGMLEGGDYPCGRAAREALVRLVGGGPVTCEARRRDRYDRLLAHCEAHDGVELNRAMVEQGWAVAYGGYADAEREARDAGRGVWAGTFERPQDWRRVHGGLAEAVHDGLPGFFDWLSGLLRGRMPGNDTGEEIAQ